MYAKSWDLMAVMGITLIAVVLAFATVINPVTGLIFGLPLVLVLPGYAITTALAGYNLGLSERIALSLGLSIAITAVGGLILNYTPWGLQPGTWSLYLGGIALIFSGIALLRRQRDYPGITAGRLKIGLNIWQGLMLLGAVVVVVAAILIARAGAEQQPSTFTQLWALPANQGNPTAFKLGIENSELTTVKYRLEIQTNGKKVQEWADIELQAGQKWDVTVNVPTEQQGATEALLFRQDQPNQVYRTVRIKS